MRWLVVVLGVLLAWPARADEVERFTLANGLRVVLAPNQHHSRAMLLVRYTVGHRDDPKGYRGLAHLTEHLTFTQLDGLAELERLGASDINGVTMPDETVYTAYLPRRGLQTARHRTSVSRWTSSSMSCTTSTTTRASSRACTLTRSCTATTTRSRAR
jgi:hypothetical protein